MKEINGCILSCPQSTSDTRFHSQWKHRLEHDPFHSWGHNL